MIFLVVDIQNYDLLLGLDFLMNIKVVVDVEKGIILVQNSSGVTMEALPLHIVNMLQLVTKLKEAYLDKFNNLRLEHLHIRKTRTHNFQFPSFNDYCDDFFLKMKQ